MALKPPWLSVFFKNLSKTRTLVRLPARLASGFVAEGNNYAGCYLVLFQRWWDCAVVHVMRSFRPWNRKKKKKQHFITNLAERLLPCIKGEFLSFQTLASCLWMLCGIDLYFPNVLEWTQEFDAAADAATLGAFLMLRIDLKITAKNPLKIISFYKLLPHFEYNKNIFVFLLIKHVLHFTFTWNVNK